MGANSGKLEEHYDGLIHEAELSANNFNDLLAKIHKHMESKALDKEWKALSAKDKEVRSQNNFEHSRKFQNLYKNRYGDILPLDSTRVKLKKESEDGSDYINANHVQISTYHEKPRDYICSQAPVTNTLNDFHQMLWEQEAKIVVMLTNYEEGGRLKADKYLPHHGEGPKKYGEIEVEVTGEEIEEESYTIRTFTMKKDGETRTLTQFHYLAWPDHGVPSDPKPLLKMARKIEEHKEDPDKTKLVIHCSAGIGRTGTFILITEVMDHLLKEKEKQTTQKKFMINVMKLVDEMRKGRTGMVQHYDQYEFCYKTIAAYIEELSAN